MDGLMGWLHGVPAWVWIWSPYLLCAGFVFYLRDRFGSWRVAAMGGLFALISLTLLVARGFMHSPHKSMAALAFSIALLLLPVLFVCEVWRLIMRVDSLGAASKEKP